MASAEPGAGAADPGAVAAVLRRRAAGGRLWLAVDGTSMGRRYREGSRVLVVAVARAPRPGEVWAFCNRDADVVVHRALGRLGGRWVFRGDACRDADAPVPNGWLIGVVTWVDGAGRQWRPRAVHAMLPLLRAVARRAARLAGRV